MAKTSGTRAWAYAHWGGDPPARPLHPLLRPQDPKIQIPRIEISLFTNFGGRGGPENMSFCRSKFLVIPSRTYFLQKLSILGFPRPRDYENSTLREILRVLDPLRPLGDGF